MAERCEICLRGLATLTNEFEPDLCTRALDAQQWRRNECFHRAILVRDRALAVKSAQMARAVELLKRQNGTIDAALVALSPFEEADHG